MATTNKVKGWTGVLMIEDSSSHWPTKRRHVYYETSRRAGLEFVCVFGHDELSMLFQCIATPSAELEYVSDRDGGFKQPLERCKLADPLGVRVF